jgi:hypothetical protein
MQGSDLDIKYESSVCVGSFVSLDVRVDKLFVGRTPRSKDRSKVSAVDTGNRTTETNCGRTTDAA